MNKNTILLLPILLIFFSSCKKENGIVDFTIIAKDNMGTKSHLYNNYVAWDNGDQININGQLRSVSVNDDRTRATISGVTANETDGYRAVFPASIATGIVSASSYGTITLPAVQTYHTDGFVDIPMVAHASASDNTLSFYTITGLMKITVQGNTTVRFIRVSASGSTLLSGSGNISGTDNSPVLSLSNGTGFIILDCGNNGVSVDGSRDFYVVVPQIQHGTKFTITVYTEETSNGEYLAYTKSQSNPVAVYRSQLGYVPFELSTARQIQSGELCGKFSVSPTKKVAFSRGNLQFRGSQKKYNFAIQQHQYIVTANTVSDSSARSNQDAWIDMFGFATSGYTGYNQLSPYPWCTSTTFDQYRIGVSGTYDRDIDGNYAYADWGVFASSKNNQGDFSFGEGILGNWRTLSKTEWEYLLYSRSGDCFAKATITNTPQNNTRTGLIIFPDNYTSSLSNINNDSSSYSSNSITYTQWCTLAEAGCVFLPAAGYRNNASMALQGSYGVYSSTTRKNANKAYYLSFSNAGIDFNSNLSRAMGKSVRLVKDID